MPPPPLVDLSTLDLSQRAVTAQEIYDVLPQRHEFALLDGIVDLNRETGVAVAIKHIRPDDWWTRGHIPDRPVFPGVLMIEAAAQLAAYWLHFADSDEKRFMMFVALDKAKFRGMVTPPCDLIIVHKFVEYRKRRFIVDAQQFVDGKMVFEGHITGMLL